MSELTTEVPPGAAIELLMGDSTWLGTILVFEDSSTKFEKSLTDPSVAALVTKLVAAYWQWREAK